MCFWISVVRAEWWWVATFPLCFVDECKYYPSFLPLGKKEGDCVSGGWYKAMKRVQGYHPPFRPNFFEKITKLPEDYTIREFTHPRMVPPPFCKQKRGIGFANRK